MKVMIGIKYAEETLECAYKIQIQMVLKQVDVKASYGDQFKMMIAIMMIVEEDLLKIISLVMKFEKILVQHLKIFI